MTNDQGGRRGWREGLWWSGAASGRGKVGHDGDCWVGEGFGRLGEFTKRASGLTVLVTVRSRSTKPRAVVAKLLKLTCP